MPREIEMAKFTCFVCPVQQQCADYRKKTGSDYGIWAGELQRGEE